MAQINRQKEITKNEAAALKKKKDEAATKADLDNITALVVEANRKAAAKAKKIKTTQ